MTKESLLLLKQGISDWLVTDCADLHDPESVVKARKRIDQAGGVIGYTAVLFEVIDGLLKEEAITAIKQVMEQEKALQTLHDENDRLGLYKDVYGQPEQKPVTVLPDGSAFAVMSYPLPKDHWLYAERQYNDGEYEPVELGKAILTHEMRDAVVSAVRYAIRSATNCGKENDFDPDALVQNAVYALCGPYTSPPKREPEPEPVACECHRCIAEKDLRDSTGRWPLGLVKMILCPTCGNKRCPKASDHRLDCTDSNEPGQSGSVYTSPPKREPDQEQEPVAWLHEVVSDDGDADQALSFAPDNFPLKGVGGFKSLSVKPLYTSPPKREWQGLTEEEKGWCAAPTMRETIERVETKLKAKNGFPQTEKNT